MQRVWLMMLCAAALGCLHRPERPAVGSVVRSLAPAAVVEGLYLESLLLERPWGDSFLNDELWKFTLPVGSQETRVLLAENGLRAGILTGHLPPRFQKLLEDDAAVVNPRGLTFALRRDEVIPTAGPHDKCHFQFLSDLARPRVPVRFSNARAGILVRPEATADNRVQLLCEPRIQYGEKREWFRPSTDNTEFVKHQEVPQARYPECAFETVLSRDDYLLIGCSEEHHDTLGEALFRVEAHQVPYQRVLVLRSWVVNAKASSDLPALGSPRRPSIAAQAAASCR
ncbi:MAG: hypothetical protein RMJ56_08195 [Gemmataceae bacterium]|nr:hypothetical protein [Gemmata sp.]MDW8197571.1 hypothetical protein [Gemmataceae bacterium]